MEHTGSYHECLSCMHIIDYSDSHCPECGGLYSEELNANDVRKKANQLLIVRDFNKNEQGKRLLKMLESHDD